MAQNKNPYIESLKSIDLSFQMFGCPSSIKQTEFLQKEYKRLYESYGKRFAVSQLKAYYQEAVRASTGLPVIPLTPEWKTRDRKTSLPKSINSIFGKWIYSKKILDKRRALSFLRCYESITLSPITDLSTVVEPSEGNHEFQKILPKFESFCNRSNFVRYVKKRYNKHLSSILTKEEKLSAHLHFTCKAGVSGKSFSSAGEQTRAIGPEMENNLIELNKAFGRSNFEQVFKVNQQIYSNYDGKFSNKSNKDMLRHSLGRICFIPDKGGKTRLVAIGNYWIQESLLNIHKLVYSLLSNVETDGTYGQDSAFDEILRISKERPVWSFDLTAATDRFPIGPQAYVMKFLNENIGSLWIKILNEMTFEFKGSQYKYEVGQPMGLYSSWGVFALTHHFVIQYCAYLEGFKFFREYRVLGDDVAIWNKRVAERYRIIMTTFGVKINETKSFIPENPNHGPCIAEFAKRISYYGEEISPISSEQSRSSWRNVSEFPQFVYWLESRRFPLGLIPASRIFSLGKFSIYHKKIFVLTCSAYQILRGTPLKVDLTEYIRVKRLNTELGSLLHQFRVKRLAEQVEIIKQEQDNFKVDLEESLGIPIPEYHYFNVSLETRKLEIQELIKRLYGPPPGFTPFPGVDYSRVIFVPRLKDVEFVPYTTVESVLDGLTQRRSKQQMMSGFIITFSRSAFRNIDESVWLLRSPGDRRCP